MGPLIVTAPAVAVLLTTYHGSKHLERLWATLSAQDYPSDRWRLIVVENGPDRDAARWFAEWAPHVRVLVPGENLGYAGGNALASQEALAAGSDYILVVTQDTHLEPNAMQALVEVAETHPAAGAVQPKLLRREADGEVVIH